MVTVSSGSEVRGISKAMGGRLSRRLTLTVVEAIFAKDWAGSKRRNCSCLPSDLPARLFPPVPALGPVMSPSLDPRLTDSTWISVIFQKTFQKCTSRF